MGSMCSSGSREQEIDMYMNKYHQYKKVKTASLDDYEVSKQQWSLSRVTYIAE